MTDNKSKLLHADLTYAIRAMLFHVGNHLWPGLPEKDFQRAVSIGLAKRKVPHSLEEQFHVYCRGVEVGRYYCDVVVDHQVILELKVVPALTGLHRAQVISYLRVSGADVGLLVNFGGPKVEIERYTHFYAQRRPDFTWQPQPPDDPSLLYPDLEILLELPVVGGAEAPRPVDAEVIRRQASSVFYGIGYDDWRSATTTPGEEAGATQPAGAATTPRQPPTWRACAT